jgi:hypothetical protein
VPGDRDGQPLQRLPGPGAPPGRSRRPPAPATASRPGPTRCGLSAGSGPQSRPCCGAASTAGTWTRNYTGNPDRTGESALPRVPMKHRPSTTRNPMTCTINRKGHLEHHSTAEPRIGACATCRFCGWW